MSNYKEAIDKSRVAAGVGFTLRPKQTETLEAVLQGRDVLSVLCTGYGKTLTYALLPMAWDTLTESAPGTSIVVVISPLIALMEDQLVRMDTLGIPAAYLGSNDTTPDMLEKVHRGEFPIVMMSPEAVFTEKWRDILESKTYRSRVKTIVVDECHCAVIWGEEFRTDYGRIGELRSVLTNANMLALTASAPPGMRNDIYSALSMRSKQVRVVEICADRANIFYSAQTGTPTIEGSLYWLVDELRNQKQLCKKYIIYCRSVKHCTEVYDFFDEQLEEEAYMGAKTFRTRLFGMFHRPTSNKIKKYIVNNFPKVDSSVRVVICTIAFGMGIDVPDVTGVIHWGASRSLEGFFQESGRAGRKTNVIPQAFSLVYYRPANVSNNSCDKEMRKYCKNEELLCRRRILLKHFSPKLTPPNTVNKHNCCDVCHNKCKCGHCPNHIPPQLQVTDGELAKCGRGSVLGRDVSPNQSHQLQTSLLQIRDSYNNEYSLITGSLRTGLNQKKIDEIVNGVTHIHCTDDLMTEYLYDMKIACQVMEQIDIIFG